MFSITIATIFIAFRKEVIAEENDRSIDRVDVVFWRLREMEVMKGRVDLERRERERERRERGIGKGGGD